MRMFEDFLQSESCVRGIYGCGKEQLLFRVAFLFLFSPTVHTFSTMFVTFFLCVPEKTKLLLWGFYRLTCILNYLLASLVTMTRTARRLCSVISSSGMTLTVAHSGEGGENQLSKSRWSGMLFAFFGEVGSSAAGGQRSGKAQR